MAAKRGRKALDPSELRNKSWRRMITLDQWLSCQAYLEETGRSMSDVVWNGPNLKTVIARGAKLRASSDLS